MHSLACKVLVFLLFLIAGPVELSATTTHPSACLNNLRQIDGAKEQLALEQHLGTNSVIETWALAAYIKGGEFPTCPSGGTYTIGRIGEFPSCSISDHSEAGAARLRERHNRRDAFMTVGVTVGIVSALWLTTGAIVVFLDRNKRRVP